MVWMLLGARLCLPPAFPLKRSPGACGARLIKKTTRVVGTEVSGKNTGEPHGLVARRPLA